MSPYGQAAAQMTEGIAIGFLNNALAADRENQARADNYRYGEMAADNADARTRALYADFYSPEAMVRQYKQAGLSPSLMYGQGAGAGGTTPNGAQGNGAGGIAPTTYGISPVDMAQIDLLKAETRKTNAEADTEEGTNAKGAATIENIKTDTENKLAQAGLYEAEKTFKDLASGYQKLQNDIMSATTKEQIRTIAAKADKEEYEATYWDRQAELANLEFEFQDETYQKRKEILENQAKEQIAQTIKLYSESSLNGTEQKAIITRCEQAYLDYLQRQEEILIKQTEANVKIGELKNEFNKTLVTLNQILLDSKFKEMGLVVEQEKMLVGLLGDIIKSAAAFAGATAVKESVRTTKKK